MLLRSVFVSLALFLSPAFATFGVTVSGRSLTVDTDGGLVFTGMSSAHAFRSRYQLPSTLLVNSLNGDITSLKFNGVEAQDSRKMSQIVGYVWAGRGRWSDWFHTGVGPRFRKLHLQTHWQLYVFFTSEAPYPS